MRNTRPILCTACHTPFSSWQNWQEHRATIQSWEMHRHEGHTRRCLSPREWAFMVLAETMGLQEQAQTHSEHDVDAREGITESGLVVIAPRP